MLCSLFHSFLLLSSFLCEKLICERFYAFMCIWVCMRFHLNQCRYAHSSGYHQYFKIVIAIHLESYRSLGRPVRFLFIVTCFIQVQWPQKFLLFIILLFCCWCTAIFTIRWQNLVWLVFSFFKYKTKNANAYVSRTQFQICSTGKCLEFQTILIESL